MESNKNNLLNNDIIINDDVLGKKIKILDDINKKTSRIIISLTTLPSRFILDEFDDIICSLLDQVFTVDYIIINLCKKYKRTNEIEYDENYYFYKLGNFLKETSNIHINICDDDYGPITSVFGLFNFKKEISDNDIIISIEDKYIISDKTSFYHAYIHQLYQSNIVSVNNNNDNHNIFNDHYDGIINTLNTWSIKYKYLKELLDFYNEISSFDDEIWKYDGIILTMFYKKYKLYCCSINLKLSVLNSKININRLNRDYSYYNKFNLDTLTEIKEFKYTLDHIVNERFLLFNCENIIYCPKNNLNCVGFNNKNFIITVLCNEIFCLTVSSLDDDLCNNNEYYLLINDEIKKIVISSRYKKFTLFIKNNKKNNSIITHYNYSINIFQTKQNNNINIYELYCICSILSYQPDIKYLFYNEEQCINYIKTKTDNMIEYYNALIPGAYKCDLFRALHIYCDGGIYMDFKMLLMNNLTNIVLNEDECFCKDLDNFGVYNAFLYSKKSNNQKLNNYIKHIIQNITNNFYGDDWLCPTGPKLLNKYVPKPNAQFIVVNNKKEFGHKFGYIEKNNRIIIKNIYSVNKYYSSYKNISTTKHYGILWQNKNIYVKNINYCKSTFELDYLKNIEGKKNEYIYIYVCGFKIDDAIIKTLKNQKIMADNIFIINNINELKKNIFNDDDKILFIMNPDKEYLEDTITLFNYCHQLYQPDFCWSENSEYYINELFSDEYDFISSKSFELFFEYRNMNKIFFDKTDELYNCKIIRNKYIVNGSIKNDKTVNIDLSIKNINKCNITNKNERYLLKNLKNVEYYAEDNRDFSWFMKVNFILTFIDKNKFAITIYCTERIDCKYIDVYLRINDVKKKFTYGFDCNLINKKTYIEDIEEEIIYYEPNNYNFNIMQTAKTNCINLEKYYTICSVLAYIPDVKYVFFNNNDSIEYLKQKNKELAKYYNKLNPGAYKSDLFRIIYIYFENGIYFDCKFILMKPFSHYLKNKNFYCNDGDNRIYNAILFNIENTKKIQNYINNIFKNIYSEHYGIDPLDVISCTLLGKYIKNKEDNIIFNHTQYMVQKSFCLGHVENLNNIKIIQTGYSLDYYNNGTYLDHYDQLWTNKKVYNLNIDTKMIKLNNNDISIDSSTIRIFNSNISIIKEDIMDFQITITIPTNNMLEYLEKTLNSLKDASAFFTIDEKFKNKIILIFGCEPNDKIIEYINKIDWIKYVILKNEKKIGIRQNPYNLINYAFESGSKFNLHLEDDILCSKNLFYLFYYYYKNQSEDYFIYGMFEYIKQNNGINKFYQIKVIKSFIGYGWITTDYSWNKIKEQWFTDPIEGSEGWNISLNYYIVKNNLKCLNVSYPYTKHFGEVGVYTNKHIIEQKFEFIKFYDDTIDINKFTIV